MSKSMAIEGVMKIFLMIAVIIVGMSFLMKAFGIDIIGWLQERFAGFGVPTDGKILYIKMDPDDNDVHAFFLAKEKDKIQDLGEVGVSSGIVYMIERYHAYFMPDKLDEKSCVIYTVKERDGAQPGMEDKGYYYYVNPGAIIQKDTCNSLGDCIKNFYKESGCEPREAYKIFGKSICGVGDLEVDLEKCSKLAGKFVIANCGCAGDFSATCDDSGPVLDKGTDRKVEKEPFQPRYDFVGSCNKEKLTSKCNLLVLGEYNIQYGLLCGDDGNWHVCKKTGDGKFSDPETVNKLEYKCEPDGDVFKWTSQLAEEIKNNLNSISQQLLITGAEKYNIGDNMGIRLSYQLSSEYSGGLMFNVKLDNNLCLASIEKCRLEQSIPCSTSPCDINLDTTNLLPGDYTLTATVGIYGITVRTWEFKRTLAGEMCSMPTGLGCSTTKDLILAGWYSVKGESIYRLEWCKQGITFGSANCCPSGNCFWEGTGKELQPQIPAKRYAQASGLESNTKYNTRVQLKQSDGTCIVSPRWSNIIICTTQK